MKTILGLICYQKINMIAIWTIKVLNLMLKQALKNLCIMMIVIIMIWKMLRSLILILRMMGLKWKILTMMILNIMETVLWDMTYSKECNREMIIAPVTTQIMKIHLKVIQRNLMLNSNA